MAHTVMGSLLLSVSGASTPSACPPGSTGTGCIACLFAPPGGTSRPALQRWSDCGVSCRLWRLVIGLWRFPSVMEIPVGYGDSRQLWGYGYGAMEIPVLRGFLLVELPALPSCLHCGVVCLPSYLHCGVSCLPAVLLAELLALRSCLPAGTACRACLPGLPAGLTAQPAARPGFAPDTATGRLPFPRAPIPALHVFCPGRQRSNLDEDERTTPHSLSTPRVIPHICININGPSHSSLTHSLSLSLSPAPWGLSLREGRSP